MSTVPDAVADPAVLAAGVATVYEPEQQEPTTAPTRGQRIARELRELADRIETAGDDAPTQSVNFHCGWPATPAEVSDARTRVEQVAGLLDLPAPATHSSGLSRYYSARRSNAIRVWVYCSLPECTCARCGQDRGCGGGS